MRIVISTINPLFPEKVIGGSTIHIRNLATRLAQIGHDVEILCTRHPDSATPFRWHTRALVRPILTFKQPFPEPYAIPAYAMAENVRIMSECLGSADRYFMNDGEFLFPPVYSRIPTVVAMRDNAYPETMLGSFLFQGDRLITVSSFSREVLRRGAGRFLAGLDERVVVIPNGFDHSRFKPMRPESAVFDYVPSTVMGRPVVLHPHRPEQSKGLRQTIEVVDHLVRRFGFDDLIVLVPRWCDTERCSATQAFQGDMERAIESRGLTANFVFHEWIPHHLMPSYYNVGDLTLTLGEIVEGFGNTPFESLACGTPAIPARVAAHRTLVPDDLLAKVHFGDIEGTAALAARILRERSGVAPELSAHLRANFDIEDQLDAYAEAILGARKLPPIQYRFAPLGPDTRYRLAPWCYEWGDTTFWHDFSATHERMPALSRALAQHPDGLCVGDHPDVVEWYRAGYVVPEVP